MIEELTARPILDSRGDWTIEVVLRAGELKSIASVPQGESRGSHEVASLPVDIAVKNIIEIISPAIAGFKLGDLNSLDTRLKELDGTTTKAQLGGNAILGVSMAYARLSAWTENLPLWRFLRNIFDPRLNPSAPPRLLALMIEGGLHAGGGSPFQEYLFLPRPPLIAESVSIVAKLYGSLRELVGIRFGPAATHLGDEGAFAPPVTDPLTPFALMIEAGEASGLIGKFDVGLDAAANNTSLTPEELIAVYDQMRENYPFRYLEDPFKEDDPDHFAALSAKYGGEMMIAGDDLTVTNVERMKLVQAKRSINAMIVKPNQIGTVTETLEAVRQAREYGWKIIVSHRGRETNDDFIADLAWGVGADGIKLGAPARGERVAKYNRLLEIEAANAVYLSP